MACSFSFVRLGEQIEVGLVVSKHRVDARSQAINIKSNDLGLPCEPRIEFDNRQEQIDLATANADNPPDPEGNV